MGLPAILRDEGHEVNTVLRGDDALDVARLMRPDVVILDINMPGMRGYAVAGELRKRHGAVAPLLIAIFRCLDQAFRRRNRETGWL
jgi:two-component system OmpR family response regulator